MKTHLMSFAVLAVSCSSAGCTAKNRLKAVTTERDQSVVQLEESREKVNRIRANSDSVQDENASARRIEGLQNELDGTRITLRNAERSLQQKELELSSLRSQVSALEDQLRKTASGNVPPKQQVAATAAIHTASYSSSGNGHWIRENIGRGEYIVLEDGSLWQVETTERIDASLWMRTESIIVVETPRGYSPYKLVNEDTGEAVGAEFAAKR